MTQNETSHSWATELLDARDRSDQDEESFERFIDLVERTPVRDLFTAKALVATLTNVPVDNGEGEGEAVESVLSGFDPEIRIAAIPDALPRILQTDKEIAQGLIETEARFHRDSLLRVWSKATPEIRMLLVEVLGWISMNARQRGVADVAGEILTSLA